MLTARSRTTLVATVLALTAACSTGSTPGATGTPSPSPSASPSATPTPTASATSTAAPAGPTSTYQLEKLGNFSSPVWVGPVPGDPLHLWLVEKVGRIWEISPSGVKTGLVLDLGQAVSHGSEQGLLSIAFDPQFAGNKRFYVDYTDREGTTQVVAYTLVNGKPAQPKTLLTVAQPYPNHNGGLLLFDRTGMLLVGMGDGGSAGDPENRAQDLASDLGKILRIDPQTGAGAADNPYPRNKKVWALGLRNPWRFSFDTNGDLYLGDVGQNKVEELDVVAPRDQRGANYGWSVYEGNTRFKKDEQFTPGGPTIVPALTYEHASGGCSITGGLVYRGRVIRALKGSYVFGDYCAGKLLMTRRTPTGVVSPATELGVRVRGLQSFGLDGSGEILVCAVDTLYRLTVLETG